MPVFNNVLAGAAGQSGGADAGYKIERSLRFNDDDGAYLQHTPSSAGNLKKWTLSFWMKRTSFPTDGTQNGYIFNSSNTGNSNHSMMRFQGQDVHQLHLYLYEFSAEYGGWDIKTTRKYRDPAAWYHIVVAMDTTQATAADRVKIFTNGVRETEFASSSYPAQNQNAGQWNSGYAHRIGKPTYGGGSFDGYLAEINFLDGIAPGTSTDDANGSLTGIANAEYLTDFGEFHSTTGVWSPLEYTGNYGGNGFHLDFSDNSSNAALGYDANVSGTRYSSMMSGNANTNYPFSRLFDGSTSTATLGQNGQTFTFTPTPALSYAAASGGVEVYFHNTSQPDKVRINGGSWVNQQNNSGGWETVSTGDGTLNKIEFSDQASNEAVVYAIRVNGTILTDPSGANDWTVNNLTAYQAPTGNPGVTRGNTTLSYDPSVVIDGNVNTSYVDRPINGNGVNFTGIPAANTQLRVRFGYIQSGTMTTNGGHVIASGNQNGAWVEPSGISYPFTLTSISVTGGYAGDGFGINAIEVDGTIITTGSGANTDSLIDSPTNYDDGTNVGGNYCTLNPLAAVNASISNGNLTASSTSSYAEIASSFAMSSGKWYCEFELSNNAGEYLTWGVSQTNRNFAAGTGVTDNPEDYGFKAWPSGFYAQNNGQNTHNYSSSISQGDIFSLAFDADAGKFWCAVNGTWLTNATGVGNPATGANPDHSGLTYSGGYFFMFGPYNGGSSNIIDVNFGQRGSFTYTPPTGYKSLCTTNLDDPLIEDPSTAFDVALWTGNGTSQTISGLNHSPDLVWIKNRSFGDNNALTDTVRGATKWLLSNETNAELTYPQALTAFTSDGFSVGSDDNFNRNTSSFVGWTWDAGTSTVSNTDGSITSNVRANQSAGFSIVTHTGNGTNPSSIGHGLNSAPVFYITKSRDSATDWVVSTTVIDGTHDFLDLNNTQAAGAFDAGIPTSSVFYVSGSTTNASGDNYVTYCWTSVEGFSAFGSYEGTGSASNSPFVYLGFKPAVIIFKNADNSSTQWDIYDTTRDPDNLTTTRLFPSAASAESNDYDFFDVLSNGFKIRNSNAGNNGNGNTIIYAAWAVNPFKHSRAH